MLKLGIIPVTHYQQNCSIAWCDVTKKAVIIDAGGDADKILQALKQEDLTPVACLLTHGHLDHVGAVKTLAEILRVPIIGPHIDDKFWLDSNPEMASMMGFSDVETFTPDQWLKDGDTYAFGECTLDVIHCPGHTPGHVVFVEKNYRLAFVGDVLFQGSIGRTDFPKGNHQDLIASIKNKLFPLGDDITFIPGHGPNSTFGRERENNPFVSDSQYG